ncbi:putative bifunctional diguanylate cyclase/phosphodiesterase [Microvirga roseola]|uniref:putative bifunctional diguanylate cyclase/phosphodiesterase n=1 Tax=Microvirga roseola TaxID=2883126 RepID=UPI001E64BCD3|nr:bifunctional diguanylate cyclase/phosphodiesterase [Microvirga roseola]
MLLPHDDILAIYGAQGQETLRLLAAPPETDERYALDDVFSLPTPEELPPDGQRELEHLITHDELTGLSNRAALQKRLAGALVEADRLRSKLAFAVLDLDHFRDLNSVLGHAVGDAILAQTGRSIRSILPPADEVGRFGGDEFALIVKGISSEDNVLSIADHLLDAAAAAVLAHSPVRHAGASLGVAIYPDHGASVSELIQNAEVALHQAKADGRGQTRIFSAKMRSALIERLEQLSAFRAALETGELRPYYQPQMRLSDRRSHGFEALARWILPNGDILYPGHFQMALNDPDAAILLGEHMLKSISDDLLQWQNTQMPACKLSVNVTSPELKRGDYARKVASLFQTKGIPLSQLTVEITESVLLDDKTSEVAQALSELRKLGVSIALDDFGTGFASLTHLKSYAIDQLKIDRSFVTDLPFNAGDRAIVRATLSLAKNLRMETVAEGLEDERQLKYLQSLGCDYAQGFFFSPAVPAEEAENYFRKNRAYRKASLHQFTLSS